MAYRLLPPNSMTYHQTAQGDAQLHDADSNLLVAPITAEHAVHAQPVRRKDRPQVFEAHRCSNAAWDKFIRSDDEATFCHLSAWREIMTDVLGHEDRSLIALNDNGEVQGLLPLIRVRSALLGHYLVSMPFLNSGGPVGTDAAKSALAVASRLDAQASRADLLEMRTKVPLAHGMRRSDRKITVHLHLAPTQDANWKALPSKVRSQIRRPQKENLETRFGLDQREAFYDLYSRNMRQLGTPVLPASLFDRIVREFPERVEFGVVYKGDVPVAAGCGFVWRDQFEITWAASSREHKQIAPNMLLYWSMMEHVRRRGVTTFDFGRCTPGSSTHAFKKQWGGEDVPLPWAQWSAREVLSTPTPDRGMYRFAANCWRHLPLSVTNAVGPWLAAKIP